MLDYDKKIFKKIQECRSPDVEVITSNIRKTICKKGTDFSIFNLLKELDIMTIIYEDDVPRTRFISFSKDTSKNYLVLNSSIPYEEMRFDAACMLSKIVKLSANKKKNCPNFTIENSELCRDDKYFACALLMPKEDVIKFIFQRDEKGKYRFLDDKNRITLKSINVIADHFGIPFGKCASRIYHISEQENFKYTIEGARTKREYRALRDNYSEEERIKDLNKLVPNHEEHQAERLRHLIDSLHYRKWDKLSDVAKQRILVSLTKFDSVNERVVSDEGEAKKIINDYIASGGSVYDGKLITKGGRKIELSDEQLVVIGEYELYKMALEKNLVEGIIKSDENLNYLKDYKYEEAINKLTEKM